MMLPKSMVMRREKKTKTARTDQATWRVSTSSWVMTHI
jgi:hypothetical protein